MDETVVAWGIWGWPIAVKRVRPTPIHPSNFHRGQPTVSPLEPKASTSRIIARPPFPSRPPSFRLDFHWAASAYIWFIQMSSDAKTRLFGTIGNPDRTYTRTIAWLLGDAWCSGRTIVWLQASLRYLCSYVYFLVLQQNYSEGLLGSFHSEELKST